MGGKGGGGGGGVRKMQRQVFFQNAQQQKMTDDIGMLRKYPSSDQHVVSQPIATF